MTPEQPVLTSDASQRKRAIQTHRTEVLRYARSHPSKWVPYWVSPTPVTSRSVMRNLRPFTVGERPVKDRDGVYHGAWSDEGWSIRRLDVTVEVRYNGPFHAGMSPVPEWA